MVVESYGYYHSAVTITIEGQGLSSPGLAEALMALPKDRSAHKPSLPARTPLSSAQGHHRRVESRNPPRGLVHLAVRRAGGGHDCSPPARAFDRTAGSG